MTNQELLEEHLGHIRSGQGGDLFLARLACSTSSKFAIGVLKGLLPKIHNVRDTSVIMDQIAKLERGPNE